MRGWITKGLVEKMVRGLLARPGEIRFWLISKGDQRDTIKKQPSAFGGRGFIRNSRNRSKNAWAGAEATAAPAVCEVYLRGSALPSCKAAIA